MQEEKVLEVISNVTETQKERNRSISGAGADVGVAMDDCDKLDILITAEAGEDCVRVRISRFHSNISYIEKMEQSCIRRGV